VDTAGRLPTQLHLMEELRKIKRVVDEGRRHRAARGAAGHRRQHGPERLAAGEGLRRRPAAHGPGRTKLDGTAKGGVLAAIAQEKPLPVYFIGVGEKLEDLETFKAREFALALLS
jgi:fused signal recognition particle receptor